MKIDLHNHTHLCNHASGEMETYIQKAIEKKIAIFGFSDHAPMHFDPNYRMTFEQMKPYEDEVLRLKERYKEQIEILLAYEVDYLPGYMDERVLDAEVDYLIGSVHFIDNWGFDNPEFIGTYKHKDIDSIWHEYFALIEAMAESRLFDIVGHLDLIKIFKYYPAEPILSIAEPALQAIKKSGMSIELNAAGFDKPVNEAYPSKALLERAFELNIPITLGSDAHAVEQVDRHNGKLLALAREIGYNKIVTYQNRSPKLINI